MGYDGDKYSWENRSIRSANVCIGEVVYEPGGSCGPRVQRDYQLVFLHSGELSVHVDDRRLQLPSGFVGLFFPGHREHFVFSKERQSHHSWCSITPEGVPAELRAALARAPFRAPCSKPLQSMLASALTIGGVNSETAGRTVDYLGLALLSEFVNTVEEIVQKEGRDPVVQKAVQYLREHFHEEECLQQLHHAAGVSRNTLIQRFRSELQTTPSRYLWRLRTERGLEMLVETGRTITEIARRCGFQCPFHFSRLVRQLQGIPPREVRDRAWGPATKEKVKARRSK